MLVILAENITATTETMTQKLSIYVVGMSTIYSNSYLKLHNTHLLHLFVDMYILKFFFLKKHDFASLSFTVKKFQEMATKSLFLSFQNSFSASYFPISQEPLDQNSSLTPLWNNN